MSKVIVCISILLPFPAKPPIKECVAPSSLSVIYKSIVEFKILIKNKSVSKNTIVFNNLVVDIEDYNNNWEVPALKSWHSRFF